ncbi:MAG: type II toxin-antitoxin system RelE/ParE family toxin [Rhizobium sp.]|nr:type II toxin-antitoxin system RelE/ParE family toxin [Rhizobium sp.]
MGTVVRRPLFIRDLRDAWAYIAQDNPDAADRFVRELERRYALVSDNPSIGSARFARHPDVRLFPYRSHVVIYRALTDGSGIELIRMIHAARDYRRFYKD